ncbi:HAD superfamily hydrolase (TIGR01509 family) [Amycolatopsis echigonensis]|uniref:HAD superfamily hydrolase (TIGR01509 family) n=1 Tax=Amycolatopsis echigonensis TaxID=2576905 RepID=A0A2N3WP80_9PSEU|nr:HAD-IA family hydrolase [Amycolatopsis niigatensis]PKV95670.1 HAD superfamily hydrolase (TIGR01509 family) [Amycolatopsis niigatensis]
MSREDWAAVVFDVDGTLVDSERDGHRLAFNAAFASAGLPYRWDVAEYGDLLGVAGGRERLTGYLESKGHPPEQVAQFAAALHADKTRRLRWMVAQGAISPRPGVRELILDLALAGVRLAVATTGSREWVAPLLGKLFGATTFPVVVTGDDVPAKKPDPAAYLKVLTELGLPAADVLAVEDSAVGLRAALAAGLDCVVVANDYTRGQDFTGALAVYPGFARFRSDRSGPVRGLSVFARSAR